MEGTVNYIITVKQHQKRLFHSLIIAEPEGMMYNPSLKGGAYDNYILSANQDYFWCWKF